MDKFCAGAQGKARGQCMREHKDQLSDACKSAMAEARSRGKQRGAALRAACKDDMEKFCADAQGGKARGQCMREHKDQLSDACKSAVAEMRSHRKHRRSSAAASAEPAAPSAAAPAAPK
jgi:multidrug efflux system membrane fusion protein